MSSEKARRWMLEDDMIHGVCAMEGPTLDVDESVEVAEVSALRAELEEALMLTRPTMNSLARVDIEDALDAVLPVKEERDRG